MTSFFDKLNLRPHERRLIVGVAIAVFVVLNLWFVWPMRNDWIAIRQDMAKARETLETYQEEVAKIDRYQAKLAELENTGSEVADQESALQLQRIVQNRAIANDVKITQSQPAKTGSLTENRFFDENALTIRIDTGHQELVNFLIDLAGSSSIIRVKSLNLQPDTSQTRLQGWITFVASYQKKPEETSSAAPSPLAAR